MSRFGLKSDALLFPSLSLGQGYLDARREAILPPGDYDHTIVA
jgi:hypothetical protein